MAENVKVIIRCRPMNQRESDSNAKSVVNLRDCMVEVWDPNDGPAFPKQFTFDSVYGPNSRTENIYNDICYPLIESVLEGYNSTIFVYGQTGCGKSYTMEGNKSATAPDKGIISRAFEHVFEAISLAEGIKYLALVSYLEIYNEQIRDLLLPGEKATLGTSLSLKEIPNEGVIVPGLTTHPVHNMQECEDLLSVGAKNRMVGATLMNQNSSRSHSIFTISLEQITNASDSDRTIKRGKLNLVDLAGSERQAKTGATGDRLKEATKINLSLSALGNVISALVDGKTRHIPYRDSKLTRLLQDSLGGNTRTLMIACIGPAARDYMETLSTLRYANRAKNIHNEPRINEDPKDAMLRQYQQEIENLKKLLETRQSTPLKVEDLDVNENRAIAGRSLDTERDRLIQEYRSEMEKLKNLHESERAEKENIMKQIETIKEEYKGNLERLNGELRPGEATKTSKEDILNRLSELKSSMIGGERANDKDLSERRKRKKLASERRLSAIAHVLAKIDMNEDREILQNQYKDITQELNLKTEALRRYRHKVKSLEKEISDIQSEFEVEREDYLETIRKHDKQAILLHQIAEKIAGTLKKECNYRDLEAIKEEAVWLEDLNKYKLPEIIIHRTKLPPADGNAWKFINADDVDNHLTKRYDEKHEDFVGNYFKPRRAVQLLNQSSKLESNAFNTWRGVLTLPEFARKNKPKSSENLNTLARSPNEYHLANGLSNNNNTLWFNEGNLRKPLQLEALPSIEKRRKNQRLQAYDLV